MGDEQPVDAGAKRGVVARLCGSLLIYGISWTVLGWALAPPTTERPIPPPEGENETSASSGRSVPTDRDPPRETSDEPDVSRQMTPAFTELSFESRLPDEQEGVSEIDPVPPAAGGPVVPPGVTPSGVRLEDAEGMSKCWAADGLERSGQQCDRLNGLTRRLEERLYVIDLCRQQAPGVGHLGTLELGLEVDFATGAVSFWSGAASQLRDAALIVGCVRQALKQFPLDGINHEFIRYQTSYSILFERPRRVLPQVTSASKMEDLKALVSAGQFVNVVRTRVRVRKAPVDGEIIGLISAPVRVTLLEQDGEWCRVLTPRRNIGWMVCWGLDLGQQTGNDVAPPTSVAPPTTEETQ